MREYRAAPAARDRAWLALMIAAPLAAFSGIVMWDGPPRSAATAIAATGEAPRPRGWDTRPEMLDAAQPSVQPQPLAGGYADERAAAGRFTLCNGRGRFGGDCVIDGDTVWYRGEKIRLADINAPEVGNPGCPAEARLGARATGRLLGLLNQGPIELAANPDGSGRDHDKYGRTLRVITRDDASLGAVLVDEGLAEEWRGYRRDWC